MSRTVGLRRQHDAAMALVGDMQARIDRFGDAPSRMEAYAVTLLLARLEGLLRIHFAQEDKLLYPTLERSVDPAVADTARRFVDEMGAIGPAFEAFVGKWRSVEAVTARPQDFAVAARGLFAALADRIHRENSELYPLADAEVAVRVA